MKKFNWMLSLLFILQCHMGYADESVDLGSLPLHAIIKNQDFSLQQKLDMISDLVQKQQVDVNAVDADGKTPLNLVTQLKGDPAIAEILLRLGAKVNQPDLFNNTPLLNALSCDQIAIAALLLKYGADTSFKNDMGQNAYDLARSKATQAVLENQEQQDAVKNSGLERD